MIFYFDIIVVYNVLIILSLLCRLSLELDPKEEKEGVKYI